MSMKAKLKVILKANETVVAESEDPKLWQNVLDAINNPVAQGETKAGVLKRDDVQGVKNYDQKTGSLQVLLAKEIGITLDELIGACSPSTEAPYITLDKHYWEALKKVTPQRGRNSIAPILVASTLLILWKEKAGMGKTTISEAQKVLGTINIRDKHAKRSISSCAFLQEKGKYVNINPAITSKAISLAKAYCLKEVPLND